MAAPKLTKEQQEQVIEMLAARELYQDIADAVGCTVKNIDYYAKKYKDQIAKAREEYDQRVMDRGLRSREKRIERLERLARRIEESLEDRKGSNDKVHKGLWVEDVKLSGMLSATVEVFAGDAVRQYRGILDDIAKETGGRTTKVDATVKFSQMSDEELVKFITGETGSDSGS